MPDQAPWEKYKATDSDQQGPWAKYGGGAPTPPPSPTQSPDEQRLNNSGFLNWKDPGAGLIGQGWRQLQKGGSGILRSITDPMHQGDTYGAMADALEGAGKIAAPVGIGMAIPAMVAAPVATATGMAGGALGAPLIGALGRGLVQASGGGPGAQRLAETGGNFAGGIAGGFAGSKIPGLFKADPHVAITRALRPTPSNPDFPEAIPNTLAAVKAINPGFKPEVKNGEFNLVPAANRAIGAHQEALEPWLQRMDGTRISGDPVIAATRTATQGMLPSEGMSGDALIARAHQDYPEMSPRDLRDRLSLLNQRLASFYNRSPGQQSAALADIPENVLKAQRDAVADALYNHLDPENEGAGPRQIQSMTGNLIDLRDAALRRSNAIVAEQPLTPFGRFADLFKSAIRHIMPTGKSNAGLAFAEGSEGRSLPLLRRAFSSIPDYQGANDFGSLPRPGPRLIGAPPDTSGPLPSGVAGFRNVGSPMQPTAPLQLPAATSPIGVSGTIVPDIIGSSSRGRGGPIGLLSAPEPGQPPVNILPTGPGSIGPAGTVPVRSAQTPLIGKGVKAGRLLKYLGPGGTPPNE